MFLALSSRSAQPGSALGLGWLHWGIPSTQQCSACFAWGWLGKKSDQERLSSHELPFPSWPVFPALAAVFLPLSACCSHPAPAAALGEAELSSHPLCFAFQTLLGFAGADISCPAQELLLLGAGQVQGVRWLRLPNNTAFVTAPRAAWQGAAPPCLRQGRSLGMCFGDSELSPPAVCAALLAHLAGKSIPHPPTSWPVPFALCFQPCSSSTPGTALKGSLCFWFFTHAGLGSLCSLGGGMAALNQGKTICRLDKNCFH